MLTETSEALAREVLIHGPIGRSALGKRLGLSPASLTRLAKPFLERGLFVQLDEESNGAVGRPVQPLDIAPDLGSFAGMKITGDAVYAVLTDARARILSEKTVVLANRDPEAVRAVIAGIVSDFRKLSPSPLVGIGVSLGGAVDDAGRVVRAPFLGWTDVDLGPALSAPTGVAVTVENDVVALVEAERWFGAGRGRSGFSVITIGAGVGYGLVVGGESVHTREAGRGPGGSYSPRSHRTAVPGGTPRVFGGPAHIGRHVRTGAVGARAARRVRRGAVARRIRRSCRAGGGGRRGARSRAHDRARGQPHDAADRRARRRRHRPVGVDGIARARGRRSRPRPAGPNRSRSWVDDSGFSAWARGAAAVAIQAAVTRLAF